MRRFAVVVGLLVASAALVLSQPAPKKVALLVGVNRYTKRGLNEHPLQYAERDVEALAAVLKEQGFEVTLLTGSLEGERLATKANVERALAVLLTGRDADDVVLVALAGHGFQFKPVGSDRDDAFYCPRDAVPNEADTLVSLSGVIDKLNAKGGKNLLLVDACRNDADANRGRGIDGNTVKELPANTVVLFSCSKGERAWESAKAGGGHGVFFHAVLEGLRGEAADRRGDVSWNLLSDYVTTQVTPERMKAVFDIPAVQTPHGFGNFRGRSPVLARVKEPKPVAGPKAVVIGDAPAIVEVKGYGIKLVRIDAGKFQMGSPKDDTAAADNERPEHEVTIAEPFYLGEIEVTVDQYDAVDNGDPSKVKTLANEPKTDISWFDAIRFCNTLSKRAGLKEYYGIAGDRVTIDGGAGYRLPTEAEWEYACRAGRKTQWSFGNEVGDLGTYARYQANSGKRLQPCGRLEPNVWKLLDMHGNAAEWCWDPFRLYEANAKVAKSGTKTETKVVRGGSALDSAFDCRSAARSVQSGSTPDMFIGFRIAQSVVRP